MLATRNVERGTPNAELVCSLIAAMSSIPFTLPDLYHGIVKVKGLISLEDEFLVIDVEKSVMEMFSREHRIIKIEPAALRDAYINRGLFRDRLCVRPKERDLLDALPGDYPGEVWFIVRRKYRRAAEYLVGELHRQMA